jgi:hypothetical protein
MKVARAITFDNGECIIVEDISEDEIDLQEAEPQLMVENTPVQEVEEIAGLVAYKKKNDKIDVHGLNKLTLRRITAVNIVKGVCAINVILIHSEIGFRTAPLLFTLFVNRAVGLFFVVFGMSSERWLASVSSPPLLASLSTVTSPPSSSVPTSIVKRLTKSLPFRDSSLPILPRLPNTLTAGDGSHRCKLKLSGEWFYGRCAALLPPWWLCLLLFTLSGASGRM